MNQRLANRIFPPLVVLAVVGGVWYAVTHRPESVESASTDATVAARANAAPRPTESEPEPLSMPVVEALPGTVKITVDTKKVAKTSKVQKVEFYVSNRLVGAAYSEPYTVNVNAATLQAGTHKVTAKVYTDQTTQETPAADFTSTTMTRVDPEVEAIAPVPPSTPPATASAPSQPTPAPSIGAPTDLQASATQTSAELTWTAPTTGNATSYQVWRDGVQLTTVLSTAYVDASVEAGRTYDYFVVSVTDAGATSGPSATVGATIPPKDSQAAAGGRDNEAATDNTSNTL